MPADRSHVCSLTGSFRQPIKSQGALSDTQSANHLPQQVCSFSCTTPMLLENVEHDVFMVPTTVFTRVLICCLHLCCCMVLHVTCPHDGSVTCRIHDISTRDARRKQKYSVITAHVLSPRGLGLNVHGLGLGRAWFFWAWSKLYLLVKTR